MGIAEANRTVFTKKYATFSGRASASEFWWPGLTFLLVLLVFFLASMAWSALMANIACFLLMASIAFVASIVIVAFIEFICRV